MAEKLIKEKDLPKVTSISSNDYLRAVTEDGKAVLVKTDSVFAPVPTHYWYGAEFNINASNPSVTRIGSLDLLRECPIQNNMRRCVLKDNGDVNYYLHDNNSELTETGVKADLSGNDGQVMVELELYCRFETKADMARILFSTIELPGFTRFKGYVSAYEASLDRTNDKLSSVVNSTERYRGGNNNAEWDGTPKSLLGMPATSISLINFQKYARNRGSSKWNCNTYNVQMLLYWLFVVEHGTRDSQAPITTELTPEGFKKGGLGEGVTTLSDSAWSSFNSYNPFIKCGITNSLGNKTGAVSFKMPADYGDLTVEVPSYHGIENPFGHIWKWTDGCKVLIQSDADGGKSLFYTCNNPSDFHFDGTSNYKLAGSLPRSSGYIKEVLFGSDGDILPKEIGGGSSSYFCDYFYTSTPDSGVSERGVRFSGIADNGSNAGFACSNTHDTASAAHAWLGSRLCYLE